MTGREVIHYGVKGMRWGVSGSSSKKGSSTKKLSNKELRNKIERMNLEKKYTALKSEQNQSTISRGAKILSSIIGNAAKQAITNKLSSEMGSVLDNVLGPKK